MQPSSLLAALILGLALSGPARADGPADERAAERSRWLQRLEDADAKARSPLVRRLVLELDDQSAVAVALELEGDGRGPIAQSIIRELGRRAISALMASVDREDSSSPEALELLPVLQRDARRALPGLRRCLNRARGRRWLRLAEAILRLDADEEALLQESLERFRQAARLPIEAGLKEPCCLADIAGLFARLGPRALPALLPACRDPNDPIHNEMGFVLGDMAASHQEAAMTFLGWVRGRSTPLRRLAIKALGRSGLGRPEVLRTLAEALGVEDPAAPEARAALRELRGEAAAAVRALARDLRSSSAERRILAARALGALGEAARPAVTSLRRGLRDGDAPARVAQAAALARVSHDPAALPVLRSALEEPSLAGEARAGLRALKMVGD